VANGCAGTPVRFCDVTQQELCAQHADAHAFFPGAFTSTHADNAERSDATINIATSASETVILLNISCFLA
jgi:hypothetical protein